MIPADRGSHVDSVVYGNVDIEILLEPRGTLPRTTLRVKPIATRIRKGSSARRAPAQLMGTDAEVATAMEGVDADEPITRAQLSANAPRGPPHPDE